MTETPDTTQPPFTTSTLAVLRAVEQPPLTLADALDAAGRQARLLHEFLGDSTEPIPRAITTLIPSVIVEHVDGLPAPGTAFWDGRHWRIHLRGGQTVEVDAFAALHELKHVVDHPWRELAVVKDHLSRETVANHFAAHVLYLRQSDTAAATGRGRS